MHKWFMAVCVFIHVAAVAQVNLQTGAAEAGFPLYQYTDAKSRLSTGLSLNYVSGNGMRVNDMASCMGTGWELQAGGSISRIQQGEPDDQQFINNGIADFTDMVAMGNTTDLYYPNGYLYATSSPKDSMVGEACYSPVFISTRPAEYKPNFEDREQDIFTFQFNGRAGRFVIGKNREILVLEDSKLKITFNEADMRPQLIRTKITDFTVTDENGIQYLFAEKELSDVFKYKSTTTVNGYSIYKGVAMPNGNRNKIVTRWFLTEIKNPMTNEKITFTYEDYLVDMDGPRHIAKTIVDNSGGTSHMVVDRINRATKRLTGIITPDAYRVSFNYSGVARIDVPGDKPLTDISISYSNNVLYSYHFNYKYFLRKNIVPYEYSFQDAEKRFARLCLTDFQKIGNGLALPPYVFTYNLPDASTGNDYYWNVAPPFTLWSDHWGFYNPFLGTSGGEEDDGDPRAPFGVKDCQFFADYQYESLGILKSIKYPEGGSLEFQFEHNQAANSPYLNQKMGGIRVARTILFDGISHNNDIIKQYRYVQADGTTTSGWGFEMPKYRVENGMRQFKFKASDNPRGGLNIKETANTLVSTLIKVRSTQMANGALGGSLFNSGTFEAVTTQMIVAIVAAAIIEYFSSTYKDHSLSVIKSDNYNLINPLPNQYSRVEVIDEGANNGKVVYEFTNPATPSTTGSYALLDPGPFDAPYSSVKQRAASWIYGAPQTITWLNAANQPVRKIENVYNPIARQPYNDNFISRSWYVNKNVVIEENKHNLIDFQQSYVTNKFSYPVTGRLEVNKTIETNYNKNGQATSTETSYTYSPSNFEVQTVSKKDSKGDYVGATTYYTSDYDMPGIINAMKNANMVKEPVSINNWVKSGQAASQEKLINATVTEYGITGNADIRPVQIYRSKLSAPQDNTVAMVNNFDAGNFKNYPYLKPQSAYIYSGGNLIQTVDNYGGLSKSVVYDYNQRQIIAEVKNATVDEIRYTSFEADAGPWSYNAAGIKNAFAPTGRRCYDLSSGAVTATVTAARSRPYIVSLWTTGSQLSVNASQQIAPSKTGPTINGWTYYEFDLPAGAAANVSVSGNGLLDEVRYYPKNASMVTHTYDPGVGKTSECDDNNRIIRYEYDGLGRLIKVRDQYYNLIKTYEYNYKQ